MANVFDTTEDCSSAIQCLKQRGYDTVGRYYARPGHEWKTVKLPEAVALARAGMSVVAIYQDRQNRAADFDLSKGRFAGTTAYNYAAGVIFQTAGSAIYFGVDYDASESEIRDNIIPFFQGIKESFDQAAGAHGPTFRIGVYGSGLVCRLLKDGGHVELTFLSQSTGHREHLAYLNSMQWNLSQKAETSLCNMDGDPDDTNPTRPDTGSFLLDLSSLGPAAPSPPPISTDDRYTVIASGGLRLRAGPGTEFDVQSVLSFGTVVTILAREGNWALVDAIGDGSASGFAYSTYLRKV
jgi:Domain of unknown function (DUF1906)/Bacterial SH3 domain